MALDAFGCDLYPPLVLGVGEVGRLEPHPLGPHLGHQIGEGLGELVADLGQLEVGGLRAGLQYPLLEFRKPPLLPSLRWAPAEQVVCNWLVDSYVRPHLIGDDIVEAIS